MNIVYSDDKLYVDLENVSKKEMRGAKSRLFSILNNYNVEEVVINTSGKTNDNIIGDFVNDYHKNYDGVIRVNYK